MLSDKETVGLRGGTGEKIEPDSRPFLDKFDPKREERITVVTGRGKGTFESTGVFLFQDLADLSVEGRKQEVRKRCGRGDEGQCSLITHCVPGYLLRATFPFPFFPITLEGKCFYSYIT